MVSAVREGMSRVIPVPLLELFTGAELETMVCGSPDIPIKLLMAVATYKGSRATGHAGWWRGGPRNRVARKGSLTECMRSTLKPLLLLAAVSVLRIVLFWGLWTFDRYS